MKVNLKLKGKNYKVDFKSVPNSNRGFSVMAATSKDLDVIQDIISDSNESLIIQKALESHIEKKLKIPVQYDHSYLGAGYGFNIDLYSLIDKLK